MAPQERTELVEKLERSRQEFLAAVAGLDQAQATLRPEPDRWSVLECVEHVTFVEARFLGWLQAAEKLEAPRVDKEKEATLMAQMPDRSIRLKAPEAVWPAGRFETLDQAIDQFNSGRSRSVQFAQERCDDLYCLGTVHPRLGPMNGVELIVIIAAHARRHADQIRETRAALGLPVKLDS
jgi:hypothetical protein